MISLEQVKLLESKVAKAIDYVKRVTDENKRLETTLGSYQKRIEELEVLIRRFKEDQGKIEDGILAALDRLNQFEDAIEKSLSPPVEKAHPAAPQEAAPAAAFSPPPPAEEILEGPEAEEEPDLALEDEEEDPDQGSGEAELDIF